MMNSLLAGNVKGILGRQCSRKIGLVMKGKR